MATGGQGAKGARVLSARTARVALAFTASTFLTAVVAAPMAYQAHSARNSPDPTATTVDVGSSVLGSSTVPTTLRTPPGSSTTTAPPTEPGAAGEATTTTTTPGSDPGRPGTTTTSTPRFVDPPPPSVPATVAPPPTVAPPVSTTTPTTTVPQPSPEGLYFSASFLLVPALPLDGAQLVSTAFIFLDLPDVASVDFSLDGQLTANELAVPWELFGGRPLLPAEIGPGTHTVRADITFADGRTEARVATFTSILG